MKLEFSGNLWYWRGPAPFFFVTVPAEKCKILRDVAKWVTYCWGMIPVTARIGTTAWKTSLFPKAGGCEHKRVSKWSFKPPSPTHARAPL